MNWSRLPFAKSAGLVLLVGWLPLLIHIPFDFFRGGGGNPIGLGLLMAASTFIAAILLVAQGVVSLVRWRRRRFRMDT